MDKGIIKKIIFYKNNDTSSIDRTYISDISLMEANNEYGNPFMQVMNNGKYALLKRTMKDVNSADSLFGTQKRYYFATTEKFYMLSGQKIEPLNKLSKDPVTFRLPDASKCNEWLQQNKINFKKEKDVILFLNYYNSIIPQ